MEEKRAKNFEALRPVFPFDALRALRQYCRFIEGSGFYGRAERRGVGRAGSLEKHPYWAKYIVDSCARIYTEEKQKDRNR
jgi:hypothetical protein